MAEKTSEKITKLLIEAKVLSLNQISKELDIPISTISRAIKKIPGIFLKRRREGRSYVKYASLKQFALDELASSDQLEPPNQLASTDIQLASADQPELSQLASTDIQLASADQPELSQLASTDIQLASLENRGNEPNQVATEIQSEHDSEFGLMWAISISIKSTIQKLHGWEELIIELIRGIEEKNLPHFLMLNKLSFAEARLNIKLALFCKELIKEKGLPKNRTLKLISSMEYLPGDAKQEAAERFIRLSDKKAILEALKALDLEEPNNQKSQEFSDKKPP